MTEPIIFGQPQLGPEEIELVTRTIASSWIGQGPLVAEFERRLAAEVWAEHAVAVSSCTAALDLCLLALGVGPGDEVITTPFSFVASANCLLYEKAVPRFVDIEEDSLGLDPDRIADAASPRTRAVLPVHVFGRPCRIESITSAARSRGWAVIEDACEGLGSTVNGRPLGSFGDVAVFAFYPNKQITTGEGGMVVLGSPEHRERIDSERNQGRAPDMGWLDHDRLGFNYRLSDIACALGLAQLERLDDLLAGRSRAAAWYGEALAGLAAERGLALPCPDTGGNVRGWFVYVVQLPPGVERDATLLALRELGIQSKPYLPAIHLMSFYRERFGHRPGEFPVCEDVAERSLALPFFPEMSEGQVARVAGALATVL
jgi:perosamine synthetase